jgi:hypothetical protein
MHEQSFPKRFPFLMRYLGQWRFTYWIAIASLIVPVIAVLRECAVAWRILVTPGYTPAVATLYSHFLLDSNGSLTKSDVSHRSRSVYRSVVDPDELFVSFNWTLFLPSDANTVPVLEFEKYVFFAIQVINSRVGRFPILVTFVRSFDFSR